ncbi:MAG: signal peptidase I [Oscillospiraceae bacterium]|jgi:signal peptidase I|nr:signal peptidase I [Oscillospiraceae bacterium]MCI8714875.1 signal peptidase I [Oscillospiraceae bacterium]
MAEENKELTREQEGALEAEREDAAPAGQEPEEEKEPETLEGMIYCWAQALITAVVSVVLLFTFAVRLIGVSGPSMQDTLYTGDRLLVLNAAYCDFKAGDVVVINDYNAELSDTLVKRIIAVGGQTVDIDFSTGTVYVDGQELDEPYIKEPTYTTDGTVFPLTLAEDEVLVMGDNRNHSTDSRSPKLGPVKRGYLQGKAVFLLMPGRTPDTDKSDWSRVGVVR